MGEMIGQTLKHHTIEKQLGQGGFGIVYLARDNRLQRPVALKLLRPELVLDPDKKNRFLHEARAAAALTHPAIAQVYDIDEDGGTTFIAMEYIDGRTVTRLIVDGELDLLGAVEIAFQVAEGLAKAHEAGIIHRDIKSDNIMVTRDGHAKLLDFGLAKLFESGPDTPAGSADITRTLTQGQAQTIAGAVMGTIYYMSPEQARGQALGPASDIFSFGIVLYEMVTGERPFKGDSPLDTMHAIAFEEPRPVTVVRRNIPPQLHWIITRCLRKRREDRYPNAHVLAEDLRNLKRDLETGTGLTRPLGTRFIGWIERLKFSIPFGTTGLIILAAAIVLAAVFTATRVQWGNLIPMAFVGLLIYRAIRNKKRRKLAAFAKKISSLPEVRAVVIRDDRVTIVMDHAPAKTYIRISSLIDEINRRLYFGKPVTAEIKDEISDLEFRNLLRTQSVAYARDEEKKIT